MAKECVNVHSIKKMSSMKDTNSEMWANLVAFVAAKNTYS